MHSPSLELHQMAEPHKLVFKQLIADAKYMRTACRPFMATGNYSALEHLPKTAVKDYSVIDSRNNPSVPHIADAIDECSDPYRCVPLVDCVSAEESAYYSSEEAVLEGGNSKVRRRKKNRRD